ncbi:MAG: cytochrome c biogenesis protein CcsA, partial [Bacillota bacterium]|nr:cytochrome c biogenesis protein CcsA [Bacillota bacterium]
MQTLEIGLHWAAVGLYAASAVAFLWGMAFRREAGLRWGVRLAAAGLVPHTAALALRWVAAGHGPYLRRYEVWSSNAWLGLALFLLVQHRRPSLRAAGAAVLPVSLLLIGGAVVSSPEIHQLPATFKTYWLLVHILFAKLAYGSCLVGTGLAVLYLWRRRAELRAGAGTGAAAFGVGAESVAAQGRAGATASAGAPAAGLLSHLPAPEVLDELSYRFLGFGFLNIGIMIAAGAIWANDAWGSYWSWDPVETWSLISWLLYGLYLHLRRTYGWRGEPAAWLALGAF